MLCGRCQFLVPDRPDPCGKSVQPDEARSVTLLINVVFAECNETLVIKSVITLATHHRGGSLVKFERHRSGDTLLRHAHKGVVCLTLGRPPTAFIYKILVARSDAILCGQNSTGQHQLLQLA